MLEVHHEQHVERGDAHAPDERDAEEEFERDRGAEQQQLDIERKRFAAGRAEMREILAREERTINSRLMVYEQQAAFAKAQVILESSQGILLRRWPD